MIDGTEKVNSYMFQFAKWFDNLWIDSILVDGTGASVRLFNVVLRTVQSGSIQFYFIVILAVLTGYIIAI